MDYILLIIGFVLLIKGADYFVDGSSSVARLLKVPTIVIGLTVVAFGTSMPEFSVSVTAAMRGDNDLAVSNVLGSNIFNLLVVLGCCALVNPVQAKWSLLKKEFPFSIFITVILLLLNSDFSVTKVLSGGGKFVLGRWGGMLFLVLFLFFGNKLWEGAAWYEAFRGRAYGFLLWDIALMLLCSILRIVFTARYNRIVKNL